MFNRISFFFILFCFCFAQLGAQDANYPQNYFRNPVSIPIQLSANFGELRPNHWHMGLDIRTNAKENLPVYASAAGYIAKIGIRAQSFGRFIIINHPNGLSTLYGHLNDFYPELEEYVTEQQYQKESWAVELEFTPDQFPVSKGQFIAKSGNTGGSQGPHLHFEIFDTKTTKRLNPLLFGFAVKDEVPPTLLKLAVYDRRKSVFQQTPLIYSLKKTITGYEVPKIPVLKTGFSKLSFAIQANDKVSGSTNPNGIYASTLFLDGEPQVAFVLDSIDYSETLYLNAQVDYKYKYNGGGWLQHLSKLPGDNGTVYKKINGNGSIELTDSSIHEIKVNVSDANGNVSVLQFRFQYDQSLAKPVNPLTGQSFFMPNTASAFETPEFKLQMAEQSLYDAIPIAYTKNTSYNPVFAVSALHQINDPSVPVHAKFNVFIKPYKPIPTIWKDKVVIKRSYKNSTSVKKANWEKGWLGVEFGDFGAFQAFVDTIPPVIKELGKGDTINLSAASRIVITPVDNFGVIRNFRATLNGQWIRFTNDKSRNWIYKFDDRCPFGAYELKVSVEDAVGNLSTKSWWFKRGPYTPPPKKKPVKKVTAKKKTTPVKKVIIKKN